MNELEALIASRKAPSGPAESRVDSTGQCTKCGATGLPNTNCRECARSLLDLRERLKYLPSPIDLLAELTGKSHEEMHAEVAHAPDIFEGEGPEEVADSPELQRIIRLPSRVIDYDSPEVAALVEKMTKALSKPPTLHCQGDDPKAPHFCTACRGAKTMRLKPIQAVGLFELWQWRGLIGPIRVGGGKTLITYLAPVMVGEAGIRPLLFVPANLKRKTEESFLHLSRHWKGPNPSVYRIESTAKLGRVQAGEVFSASGKKISESLLGRYKPTFIGIDEAQLFKNPRAACSRRLFRYLDHNPQCILAALSGTLFRRSLKDMAALVKYALKANAPVPRTFADLEAWAGALDEKVSSLRRTKPGALLQLMPELPAPGLFDEGPDLHLVRQAFGRRFTSTPGVVSSKEGELGTSILFREVRIAKPDPVVDAHFHTFRTTDTTPQGLDVPDGIQFKRHAMEMALGFEYYWDPQPPEEWILIRRAWYKLCRNVIKHNRRAIDSEKAAKDAILKGLYPGIEIYREWQKIEPTFTPNTVSAWFSKEAVSFAAEWAERERGIVWTTHHHFAEALAKAAKLDYYGQKGLTEDGRYIMEAKPGYPCVASTGSNKLGRDLQYHWSTNLVVSPESDGLTWEQRSARTHREGQPADTVTVDWLANCTEHVANFAQALSDARAQEAITGQPQKLLYGDHERIDATPTGARWKGGEDE